jgi:hypothetical protein
MITTHNEPHLEDDEVMRAVDAPLEHDEAVRIHEHLAACTVCARRMEQLRTRQKRLSSLLQETDFVTPAAAPPVDVIDIGAMRARRQRPLMQRTWLRAAAGVVLLLGVALTMTPLQAIVVDWLREQWSRLTQQEQVTVPGDAPAPAPLGPEITFAPSGPAFRVAFASSQAGGTLTVRRGTAAGITARASQAGVELLSLPDELRVLNDQSMAGNYEFIVPASVTQVTIVVAGRVVARLDGVQIDAGTSMPLR